MHDAATPAVRACERAAALQVKVRAGDISCVAHVCLMALRAVSLCRWAANGEDSSSGAFCLLVRCGDAAHIVAVAKRHAHDV